MSQLPHFRKGLKQVFLPNFTLTLIRSPSLPPTFAKFIVPLNFNKLDIRDYLFHAYNVRVLRVRSFITQSAVEIDMKGRASRRKGVKKMTVEMDKPFIWPEEPEDYEAWSKETFDEARDYSKEMSNKLALPDFQKNLQAPAKEHRQTLAEQAKALLQGKEKWSPTGQFRPKMEIDARGRGKERTF